ncbi:M20 family metallopeptidase [Candidatus Kuenenbacteria bacterium]|nr:M20 family metallopeptidase [Candidatus Kuenenbacteria bacterium]
MTELQILQKLISIDSQVTKSNKEIVDFIVSLFPREICKVTPLKKGDLDLFNLEIKFKGEKSTKPIVFSGHTDTVPTSSKWTRNPFDPEVVDGNVFGLGTSDMKAGVACMIKLALSLVGNKQKQDVVFLFDADEEGAGTGGKNFIENVMIDPGSAKVIICEPSSGILQIGQKGALEFKVTFFGKALHSSITSFDKNLQFNAIHKTLQGLKALEEYEKKLELKKDKLFKSPTQAICMIEGGTAANVIPDECSFTINRRLIPSEMLETVIEETTSILKKVDPEVKVEVFFSGAPNKLDEESELFQQSKFICEEVFGEAITSVTSGWTQAGLFNKWGDALIWGPGKLEMCHQADEFCPVEDLEKMTECYSKLVELNN